MGKSFTVIAQVAVLFPSSVVTVIFAVPADAAVTNPLSFTVATASLLLLHATVLLLALAGATVAVSCVVAVTFIVVSVLFRETPVTG